MNRSGRKYNQYKGLKQYLDVVTKNPKLEQLGDLVKNSPSLFNEINTFENSIKIESDWIEKIEFYRRSYNRKEFSPIFSARDILEYPELIVKELPIVEEANVVESGYIISPISKEIFDSVENAQLKADMKGGIEIDCSEFTDIVINHSSYKALEQWVFDNQLGIGEKKYSKADIGRTYLRYIQKIYEVNKSPG